MNRPAIVMLLGAIGASASAQSLFQRAPEMTPEQAGVDPAEAVYDVSLYATRPPEPRVIAVNDLVTILIDEVVDIEREQEVELEKAWAIEALRIKYPELFSYLYFSSPQSNAELEAFEFGSSSDFDGDGEYERTDRLSGRITAKVIDVKPNGTLLLEARSRTQTDEEIQTATLSGYCRSEDVTADNTILSFQLYDLNYSVMHEGLVAETNRKGLIPRVLEFLFNF